MSKKIVIARDFKVGATYTGSHDGPEELVGNDFTVVGPSVWIDERFDAPGVGLYEIPVKVRGDVWKVVFAEGDAAYPVR